MVDAVYWLMLSHLLFEFLFGLSEGLLFVFPSFVLVVVVSLYHFPILLLQFHQKIANNAKKPHVFLHECLRSSCLFEDLKMRSNFLRMGYPLCSGIVDHEYVPYPAVVALNVSKVSTDDVVVHVHVEVQLHCPNELHYHFVYLLAEFLLSDWVLLGLRFLRDDFWFFYGQEGL